MSTILFGEARRVDLSADGDVSPKWSLLFPLDALMFSPGRPGYPSGGVKFDRQMLATMIANWKAIGAPAKQVNYLHRGGTFDDALPLTEKLAAGWIEELRLSDAGLEGLIRWTDDARALLLADKIRFISPEFSLNATSKLTGKPQGPTLTGAGLVNDPFLEQMPRVAASEQFTTTSASEAAGAPHMKKLIAMLALAESATETDVETAVAKLQTAATAQSEQATKLADYEGARVKLADQVKSLTEEKAALVQKLADVETAKKTAAVDAFIKVRIDKGIFTGPRAEAARKIALADLAIAEAAFPLDSPPSVKMGEIGVAGTPQPAGDKKAAQLRLDERISAMRKADDKLSYQSAHGLALGELPDVKTILFGDAGKKSTTRA